MKAESKMEILKGSVTSIETKRYASDGSASYTTQLTLDNNFSGRLSGQVAHLSKGDNALILYKQTKRSGNIIKAFYNLTTGIQKPTRAHVWRSYGMVTILAFALSMWSFGRGIFFVFISIGIFAAYKTYQKLQHAKALEQYLKENGFS